MGGGVRNVGPSRLLAEQAPNGTRFSRREASATSEAIGWKRRLGALQILL